MNNSTDEQNISTNSSNSEKIIKKRNRLDKKLDMQRKEMN